MTEIVAILILSLVASVQGQDICADALDKIPDCAWSCFQDAGRSVGCESGDLQCKCDLKKRGDLISIARDCFLQTCGEENSLQVLSAEGEVCSCAATGFPPLVSTVGAFSTLQESSAEATATTEPFLIYVSSYRISISTVFLSFHVSGASSSRPTNSAIAAVGTTSSSFINSASTSVGQSISSSPTSTSASASSLAAMPNQSTINGPTIAIAVSISIGSVILIIAILLIRQRWRKRRIKTENGQNHTANEVHEPSRMINETHEPEAIHELSGNQEYELPANSNTLRHELSPK